MATDGARIALALAIGITSSTTFVVMNSTLNRIAFPAYFLPTIEASHQKNQSRPGPESSPELLLRQWALTYRTGHAVGPTSVILSTACFLYAALKGPQELRTQLYIAVASAGLAFPFTVALLIPINLELFRRADALEASRSAAEQEKLAGGDTQTLIAKCLWYSEIRALMPVPAILLGIFAISRLVE